MMNGHQVGRTEGQKRQLPSTPAPQGTWLALLQLLRGATVIYVIVAVIATSLRLSIRPFLPNTAVEPGYHSNSNRTDTILNGLETPEEPQIIESIPRRSALLDRLGEWNGIHGPSQNDTYVGWRTGSDHNHKTSERLFLSRAFADALQPSKIVPYYYRATGRLDPKDITITTLVTSNRFKVFDELVSHYRGPISVTIHVSNKPGDLEEVVLLLNGLFKSNSYMSEFVDVHLVIDSFDRQFNMWRNVARFFARTEYVMMLDVDFYICTDFRRRIRSDPRILKKLEDGDTALVIPAFEFVEQEMGLDVSTFPSTKMDLVKLVEDGKIDMFHNFWAPGHGSTNYSQWYDYGDIYKVFGYNHAYEPYIVFKRDGTPWCDERFIGYGANKAACLFDIYLSGVDFWVLPNDFVIHRSHPYAESTRQQERIFNKQIYNDFREETCLRYFTWHLHQGTLQSPKAANMLLECRKSTGFVDFAKKMIQEG